MTALRAGQVLLLDRRASPQFVVRPLMLRLGAIMPRITYDGWVWLSGYAVDQRGVATARREVFVQWAGIRVVADDGSTRPVTVAPKPPPATRAGTARFPVAGAGAGTTARPDHGRRAAARPSASAGVAAAQARWT
ncbi:hypothetical protein [Micromonospora craterilacus]|uniref:hypothetical protein n=1 Tax=Micromonospora craterilacus TaxID=1655439 RepID=UPI0018F4F855|nr:hypothetical protein [Micromonospora craterilacus]